MTLLLTTTQSEAAAAAGTSFLLGPAGTGKTTVLQRRLVRLLEAGDSAYTILVLLAEPEHEQGYLDAVNQSGLGPYADLKITTYNTLAREMVALFWPLVARPAGFARPHQPPTFLSYDLAQLLMWRVISPMLAEGAFADLRLRPQQIVSQLLDTLNRAALNGLTLDEATQRQLATWVGEPDHLRHLADAATAARRFREVCRQNSLLDLSFTVRVFDTQLVHHPEFRRYFSERFRHLLVDNVEEQTPAGQNFVAALLDATETAAVAYDAGGGYKRFLGADPAGANQFHGRCRHVFTFDEADSFTAPPPLFDLANLVENDLMRTAGSAARAGEAVVAVAGGRYRREMVSDLVARLRELIAAGLAPADIAIIAPYLDGALRFSLTQSLQAAVIPYYLLRRRYSPREEPRVRAWLTWLALAHPLWDIHPSAFDVAEGLSLSIHGLDPARAALLAERLYRPDVPGLLPAAELPDRLVQRIGPNLVTLYDDLRRWLEEHDGRQPLDVFLHRLFNELLAQRRFQPDPALAGAAVADWLVRSAGRLRQAAAPLGLPGPAEIGPAFVTAIYQGLVTADPPEMGEPPDPNGVMISTIYGYLLAGKPVRVQVWLETAATGWWDIPRQPLSNAFVLAQSWRPDRAWTMDEEFAIRNQLLSRIVRGLAARCRDGVILASSDLDRRGVRQDGALWRALRPVRESGS